MLNNDKKRKLRGLLAKLDPKEEARLLAITLQEDLKVVESKIPKEKDYSPIFREIQGAFNDLKAHLIEKLKDIPDKSTLDEVKKSFADSITFLENKLSEEIKNLHSDNLGAFSEIAGVKKDIDEELEDLKKNLAIWKSEIISNSNRGGSMNRQIKVEGTDVLTRYTDINLKGSGVTLSAVNNNTTKSVDITFTGVSGVAWGQITGTLSNQTDLQNALNTKLTKTNFSTGSVLFRGASEITEDNANFFWDDTSNFLRLNSADVTYSVGDPSGANFTITYGSGSYTANSYQMNYYVYAYYDSPLGRVFSTGYSETGVQNDDGSTQNYQNDLSWTPPGGLVSGYYILKSGNECGYSFDYYADVGNTTTWTDDNCGAWTAGPTVTPTSYTANSPALKTLFGYGSIGESYNAGTTNFRVFSLGDVSTPLYFDWDFTNQYLKFTDGSGSRRTLWTDINASVVNATNISGTYTGTWAGNTITTARGGTGLSSWTQGDIPYYTSGTALTKLAKNTSATRYLSNTGTSNAPAWAQIDLSNGVTGDLPFANLTQGAALTVLANATNSTADFAALAAASDHQVLRRSGTALAFGAVNLAQSAAVTGTLPVGNGGTGATTFAQDTLLFGNGTSAIGSATYWKYNEANKQLYWSDGGTSSSAGQIYIGDLTHSFKPTIQIIKYVNGVAMDLTVAGANNVITASGGTGFVSYASSVTDTALRNSHSRGIELDNRNDQDGYSTTGIYARGRNLRSSVGSNPDLAIGGDFAAGIGWTTANYGFAGRFTSESAYTHGIKVIHHASQAVDSIFGTQSDGTTILYKITATGGAEFSDNVITKTYHIRSVGNALTAAGSTRADALQLAKQVNNVTTAASGTGVILPVGVIGMRITIFNAGANAIQVYASASETIDTVAGSTGVPLTNAKRCEYFFVAANTWISMQGGPISA